MTRGQLAAVLVRSFGYVDGLVGDLFIDDDGSVFEDDIDRLGAPGITRGCNPPENTRYYPGDGASRGQMASLLARALDLAPIVPTPIAQTISLSAYVVLVADSIDGVGVSEAIRDDLAVVWITESGYAGARHPPPVCRTWMTTTASSFGALFPAPVSSTSTGRDDSAKTRTTVRHG